MRDPDLRGLTGRAWKGTPTEEMRAKWPAGLDTWLMHVPGAHPLWSWYVATGCSLRNVEGVPPAKKRTPNSTHELMVVALHPEDFKPTDEWFCDNENRWGQHILTPLNLCEQVEDFTDELLNELTFLFVRAFCTGYANPDDDFRSYNRQIFAATVEHLREGKHEVL